MNLRSAGPADHDYAVAAWEDSGWELEPRNGRFVKMLD